MKPILITSVRCVALVAPLFVFASCSSISQNRDFVSPSGALKLSYKSSPDGQKGGYILSGKGVELAQAPTILSPNPADRANGQRALWSPSEHTALIFENNPDATPEYRYFLLQQQSEGGSWKVNEANFGSWKNPDAESPNQIFTATHRIPEVKSIDDQGAEISWDPRAAIERMPWSKVTLKPVP